MAKSKQVVERRISNEELSEQIKMETKSKILKMVKSNDQINFQDLKGLNQVLNAVVREEQVNVSNKRTMLGAIKMFANPDDLSKYIRATFPEIKRLTA